MPGLVRGGPLGSRCEGCLQQEVAGDLTASCGDFIFLNEKRGLYFSQIESTIALLNLTAEPADLLSAICDDAITVIMYRLYVC